MQSDNASGVSLTDLCAICHVNPLKYTCPRCGIHTCSLPCVKRHKQWAQCSGVRDPAEYRKRSELATSSSVDKDFNFITKVERTLQHAEDTVVDKGLDLAPARLRQHDIKSKVEIEMESRGIKIIKAPKALSRSKQNKTHWAGNVGCVMWTIEWTCQDGERRMSHIHETKTMEEAHSSVFGKSFGRRSHGMKRKRARDDADKQVQPEGTSVPTVKKEELQPEAEISEPAVVGLPDATSSGQNTTPTTHPSRYYYLHRPNTEARYKCLISISHDAILKEVFSNRTFIEFPTIYVRDEPPDQLREPFISEDEYMKRHGADIPINVTGPSEPILTRGYAEDGEEGETSTVADVVDDLNEAQVLEVLAKDLGG